MVESRDIGLRLASIQRPEARAGSVGGKVLLGFTISSDNAYAAGLLMIVASLHGSLLLLVGPCAARRWCAPPTGWSPLEYSENLMPSLVGLWRRERRRSMGTQR
jgi:hypothetical protein